MGTKYSQETKEKSISKRMATLAARKPKPKKATPRRKKPLFSPEPVDTEPMTFDLPTTFRDVTKPIGGPDKAFNILRTGITPRLDYTDPNNEEVRVRNIIEEWDKLGPVQKQRVDIDKLIENHNLTPARVFGMLAEDAYDLVKIRMKMFKGLAEAQMLEASVKHSLRPFSGQGERMAHLQGLGHLPSPQKAQIINVSANANSNAQALAAAKSEQKGLPSFESTMDEDHLNAINVLDHEIVVKDLGDKLRDEPLQLPEGSMFSVEDLEAISEEV